MLSSSITNSAPFENSPSTIPSNDFKKVDYYPKAVSMESIRKKLSRDDDVKVDGLATHFDDMDKSEHYILPKNDLEGDLEGGKNKKLSLNGGDQDEKHMVVQNTMVLVRIVITLALLYFLVSVVKVFLFPVTWSAGKRKNLSGGKRDGGRSGAGKIGDKSLEQLLDNF